MSSSPSASNSEKTYTITPSSSLSYSTNYKIRIKKEIKDVAGNLMTNQYEQITGFSTPALMSSEGRAVKLSLGSIHTCAITDNSTVWCWGYFGGNIPKKINNLSNVKNIGSGNNTSCVVKNDGTTLLG